MRGGKGREGREDGRKGEYEGREGEGRGESSVVLV